MSVWRFRLRPLCCRAGSILNVSDQRVRVNCQNRREYVLYKVSLTKGNFMSR